jgi:hypothetical protein
MLRDKIKKTRDLVTETKKLQAIEQKKNRDRQFDDLVEKSVPTLIKAISGVRLIDEHYPGEWKLENLKGTIDLIKSLLSDMDTKPKEKFGAIIRSIEPFNNEAKRQWSVIAQKQHQEVKRTLLLMKKVQKDNSEINPLITVLENIEKAWPISKENINIHQTAINAAKDMITKMGADKEVQLFLQKMSEGTATLADLNNVVLEWFKKQNLTSNVFMNFK